MDLRLANQVVLVAGSSRGIGRAIAERLVDEGACVVLTGRDGAPLQATRAALSARGTDRQVLAIAGDLTGRDGIDRALDATLERFGRLDHLVANVGSGSGRTGPDVPEDEWQRLFDVNFFGSVRLAQAAIPHLSKGSGASILFVASIVAVESTAAPLPYSAAKAALANYAKNLARQLGPQGIRVNTIAPGNILFDGGSWERHLRRDAGAVKAMLESVPLGRFGEPDEIASLAAYLCSPLAAFATGGCHVVDGGQTRTL